MSPPQVVIHHDPGLLAQAVAARLVTRLVDLQSARGSASIVLAGGGTGVASLAALQATPARDAIDWHALDVWWGDERWLPTGHAERNDRAARDALLGHVRLDPARVHPMPAADDVGDAETAAAAYAAELSAARLPEDHGSVPAFDVLLLGVGADGHTASLFPGQPALYDTRPVVAVHGAPKPPPTRLTLTLPAICAAHEVWVVVAGAQKAGAVALALGGGGEVQVPAAGARGRTRTLWLLDSAAASQIPVGLSRIASP